MNSVITDELALTKQHLLQALALFSAADFNIVPFEGSWTAGQVTEHIFKSINGAPHLLTGDSTPTQRDPEQYVAQLRGIFLDFSTKLKSPDFILPSNEPKTYSTLVNGVTEILDAIIEVSKTIDTSLTVTGFEFPGFGKLTRIELLNFLSVHTQRHTHQLKEIHKRL